MGLLELGCEHKEETESSGLYDGVEGSKAQCENRLKLKAPMFTDTHVREPTYVYTWQSPRKVTTHWKEVLRQYSAPNRQLGMVAMQSEMVVLSSGSKTEVLAGGLLLAGLTSTGSPAKIIEKGDKGCR